MFTSTAVCPDWRPRRPGMRRVLAALTRATFSLLTRLRIEGRENIPEKGPLLVVANHFHFADPLAVIRAIPQRLDFIGGFHMRFAPVGIRWIPRLWGLYRVRREGSSRSALRMAEETLRRGGILGVFPEGGSWADVLRPARPGTAFLASRTGAKILPVGIDGVDRILPSLRSGRRSSVVVRIGPPIGPFSVEGTGRAAREGLDRIGDAVMRAIAELIPEDRRGVYSSDPQRRREAEKAAVYPWERVQKAAPRALHRSEEGETDE